MSSLVGFLFAGERISVYEIIAIIGGFLGAMLVVNDSIFSDKNSAVNKRKNMDLDTYHYYYLGLCMAVLYTIFSSFNYY